MKKTVFKWVFIPTNVLLISWAVSVSLLADFTSDWLPEALFAFLYEWQWIPILLLVVEFAIVLVDLLWRSWRFRQPQDPTKGLGHYAKPPKDDGKGFKYDDGQAVK